MTTNASDGRRLHMQLYSTRHVGHDAPDRTLRPAVGVPSDGQLVRTEGAFNQRVGRAARGDDARRLTRAALINNARRTCVHGIM